MANTLVNTDLGGGVLNVEAGGVILVKDSAYIKFGDGSDVTLSWNGSVLLITGLPTSDPTVAGALWLNSNVLTVSAGGG